MDARFWLAWTTGSEGDVASATDLYASAVHHASEVGVAIAPSVLPLYTTTLCWAGKFQHAIDSGQEAVRIAREAGDTDSSMLALQVLGLAYAGTGAYDQAWQVFDEAARFGRDYGVGPFLARATAMSAGFHLDVFDYEGHEAVAEEARDLARSFNFLPALTSAGIDLLLNLARRGEIGRASTLIDDVAGAVDKAKMWHGWLWDLRFTQARAELALAAGDVESTLRLADSAIAQSRGRRPKYEVLGLLTRSAGLMRMGQAADAARETRQAVHVARSVGDPALVLRSALAMLAIDGDDALLAEARATASAILGKLPTASMRERFRAAISTQMSSPLHGEAARQD
jgi:tetratricopeptide (TPR) repeat protein